MTFAQESKTGKGKEKSPEQMAQIRTKRWTKILSLTQEQVPQVKAIILDKIQKMNDLKSQPVNETNKKVKHQQINVIKTDSDAKLKGVLTQEQYDLYIKTKQENRKKAKKPNSSDIEEDDDL